MFSVLMCIGEAHDLRLVAIAGLICAAAALVAFAFYRQSAAAQGGLRWSWLGLSGLVAGYGVWATHFIAMLAYQPSLRIAYEPVGTVASLVLAVLGMVCAFSVTISARHRVGLLTGGALGGMTVAATHYVGIAAVRAQAVLLIEPGYGLASLAIGAVGGAATFWARGRIPGVRGWLLSATGFVVTVCGLHFTAMAGVVLLRDPTRIIPDEVIGRDLLAIATGVMALVILAMALGLAWVGRSSQRRTLHNVRHALDAVPAGLAFFDPSNNLLSWNQAMGALMSGAGLTLTEGMHRSELRRAARMDGWFGPEAQADAALLDDKVTWRDESGELKLQDGRWIRHEAFVTQDGGGVTVLTDVTPERATLQALADARDAAEAASRAKSAFLANMSHEIRTPLNGVLGIADVLLTTELAPKQRELMNVMQSSGALLNALLTDILDLARVEAGMAGLRPEPTDLAELVNAVRDLFASRAEQKGLRLSAMIDLGPDRWVVCDPLRIRQVIGNLVNNAVKFTECGQVAIRVRRDGEKVEVQVRDTGLGFDETQKASLFGRFQQADDTSTRRHGGAGLGLTICQEYVRLMGGELDCNSEPGVGSVFGFTLDLPAISAPATSVREHHRSPGRFRVLVVDDNATNRKVLGLILEAVGIDSGEADDGALGLDAAMGGEYDAVLMDIQMPVMDGFEATRRIRAWEAASGRRRMPIYMVSANCLQEHVDAGHAAGADGHIAKPVSVAQLLAALQPHAEVSRKAA